MVVKRHTDDLILFLGAGPHEGGFEKQGGGVSFPRLAQESVHPHPISLRLASLNWTHAPWFKPYYRLCKRLYPQSVGTAAALGLPSTGRLYSLPWTDPGFSKGWVLGTSVSGPL